MGIEVGTLTISFHPKWIEDRVRDMGKTSWYIDMHTKYVEYESRDEMEKYTPFSHSCANVRLYSHRMSDFMAW